MVSPRWPSREKLHATGMLKIASIASRLTLEAKIFQIGRPGNGVDSFCEIFISPLERMRLNARRLRG
jgi:hypothetical protein